MTHSKSIFSFQFHLEEQNKFKSILFAIDSTFPSKELEDLTSSDKFSHFVSESENTYGVHDVGFCPEEEIFGFSSYEVEEEKTLELMENFKTFFEDNGYKVSDLVSFEESYNEEEDEDSYDLSQEKLDESCNNYIEGFEVKNEK